MKGQITFDELLQIAKDILAVSPTALLSGSLSLRLQGVLTMREPVDIDIFIPVKDKFIPIPKMGIFDEGGEDYPEDGWDRIGYNLDGVKIDVFTQDYSDSDIPEPQQTTGKGNVRCVDKVDIIKFKASHALGDHWTKYKHRNDIVYMMIAN